MVVHPMVIVAVAAYAVVVGLWAYTSAVSLARMRASRGTSPFISRLYSVLVIGSTCAVASSIYDIARLVVSTGAFGATPADPLSTVASMAAPFAVNAIALAVVLGVAVRGSLRQIERERRRNERQRQELEALAEQRTAELRETVDRLEADHRELERIDLELRAEHAMLDAVMNTSVGAICVVNTEGRIVFANGMAQAVLGVSAQEAMQRRYDSPEWQPAGLDGSPLPDSEMPFRRVMNARAPVHNMQMRVVGQDGAPRLLEVNGAPLFTMDDEISGVVFLITDITKRRADEELLRDSEKRFRLMVEGLPSGAVFVDQNTIYMNRAAEQLTGYARSELATVDQWFWALYGEASIEARTKYERIRDGGFSQVCVGTIRRKDGESRVIECSGYRSESALVWLLRDITSEARTEEIQRRLKSELLQNRSIGELAVMAEGVAHDCNNILTSILGAAELARHELSADDSARPYIEDIAHEAERAADLCTMMMAYTGDAEQKFEGVDVNSAVKDMVRFMQGSEGVSHRIRIRYNLADSLMNVRADASQIRKVLLALFQNAVDALGDDVGDIEVTTRSWRASEPLAADAYMSEGLPPGEYVQIVVRDTGCGMDPIARAKAFDPFFTTKPDSRGLGLTYALGIVRASSGNIALESVQGRGTTVTVSLPVAYADSVAKESSAPVEDLWCGSGTILVVDDEQNVRLITKRMLEKLGFDVLLASNGGDAMNEISKHPDVAAVILDLTMPTMDGESTFKEIRRSKPDLPVLIASGYDVRKVAGRFPSGVSSFLQKPFPLHVLSAHLRDALTGGTHAATR
ncbi:MAG: PAS domain S-box protein [Candidatus Hydrogenedentes bacterium]|nr:PAS domain S-box protein [Candidatus Hydrogenedentota bacterium]